jgi:glutamyl-tRNA synthetase
MSDELFAETMIKYLSTFHSEFFEKLWAKFDNNKISQIFKIYKSRIKTLKDIVNLSAFLINDEIKYDQEAVNKHLLKNDGEGFKALEIALAGFLPLAWSKDNIENIVNATAVDMKIGVGKVAQPIRIAVTGSTVSPPIGDTLCLIGKDKSVQRIKECIAAFQAADIEA